MNRDLSHAYLGNNSLIVQNLHKLTCQLTKYQRNCKLIMQIILMKPLHGQGIRMLIISKKSTF